mmetsp:Transcript_6836/g.16685  ORF Transcript_6836/g.16685 Transcript_6836/m.16685 type:complete len:399 (+) Transcript_6836:971-2167(+)
MPLLDLVPGAGGGTGISHCCNTIHNPKKLPPGPGPGFHLLHALIHGLNVFAVRAFVEGWEVFVQLHGSLDLQVLVENQRFAGTDRRVVVGPLAVLWIVSPVVDLVVIFWPLACVPPVLRAFFRRPLLVRFLVERLGFFRRRSGSPPRQSEASSHRFRAVFHRDHFLQILHHGRYEFSVAEPAVLLPRTVLCQRLRTDTPRVVFRRVLEHDKQSAPPQFVAVVEVGPLQEGVRAKAGALREVLRADSSRDVRVAGEGRDSPHFGWRVRRVGLGQLCVDAHFPGRNLEPPVDRRKAAVERLRRVLLEVPAAPAGHCGSLLGYPGGRGLPPQQLERAQAIGKPLLVVLRHAHARPVGNTPRVLPLLAVHVERSASSRVGGSGRACTEHPQRRPGAEEVMVD